MGKVYLVGAGPGDEGLLTVKAYQLLQNAQCVVYDRLIGDSILDLVPSGAKLIDVGKNSGNHPVPQEEINRILAEQSKNFDSVIRLKGGDCFVFGRGGEELLHLENLGIEFEVVPGISSSIAAAAYAGIPVTHRGLCSSMHIITGHRQKDGKLGIDYKSLVNLEGTLVFMMAVASVKEIADGLMQADMDGSMPCAVIENGTRPEQRKVVATIEEIAALVESEKIQSPAAIIVGKVCALSDRLDWFEKLPLKGVKVLVTRPKRSSGGLSQKLRQLGASVSLAPMIQTTPMNFEMPDLSKYTMLVFASAVGVECFFEKLFKEADARSLKSIKIAAVGTQTAAKLKSFGIIADYIPSKFCGKTLGNELINGQLHEYDRLLLVQAQEASDGLSDVLEKENINFEKLAVYFTSNIADTKIDAKTLKYVTFTSKSCVTGFELLTSGQNLDHVTALCIGETTANAASNLGLLVKVSKSATMDSMVDLLIEEARA